MSIPADSTAPSSPQVRVLVVENDIRTRNSHQVNLRRWGYHVLLAEGVGDELLADAQRKAREEACHVAIVDMRLYNDHDNADQSGLTLIPKLKPSLTIVVSGSGNDRDTTKRALRLGAFDFIGKLDDLNYLKNALKEAAKAMGVGDSRPVVDIRSATVAQVMGSLAPGKPEQVYEIFCTLFPQAKTVLVQSIKAEARTPKISNRQRAFAFRVYVDDFQPVVVKIAGVERIQRETERYAQYIHNRVPGNFYAQGHSTVLRWQLGAIVYDFIGVDQNGLGLFQDYYRSASGSKLKSLLRHLFTTTWGVIYRGTKQATMLSQRAAYSAVWGDDWIDRLGQTVESLPDLLFPLPDELRAINPLAWILRRTAQDSNDASLLPQSYLAVGHGDMLADNFFVDKNDQAWPIDYERTGPGPILQDLVLLETDILVSLIPAQAQDPMDYVRLIVKLIEQVLPTPASFDSTSGELDKAYKVIRFLRQQTAELLDHETERHSLWGRLLNIGFRLTLLRQKISETVADSVTNQHSEKEATTVSLALEEQRALLIGKLICYRLDHLDQVWPPASLNNLLRNQQKSEQSEVANLQQKQPTQERIRILFLAANPSDRARLHIDEELRRIDLVLRTAELRDRFELTSHFAVQADDLAELFMRHRPTIVHFSGHGSAAGQIIFHAPQGHSFPAPPAILSQLFELLRDNIRCVILNACYTEPQAQGIGKHIDAVIGMSSNLSDEAAITFAGGFYQSLGYGRDIQTAFELGKFAINMHRLTQNDIPRLIANRANPSTIFLHNESE